MLPANKETITSLEKTQGLTDVPDQDLLALLALFETPIEAIVDDQVLGMLENRFEVCVDEIAQAHDMEQVKHIVGRALKRTFLLGRWSVRH